MAQMVAQEMTQPLGDKPLQLDQAGVERMTQVLPYCNSSELNSATLLSEDTAILHSSINVLWKIGIHILWITIGIQLFNEIRHSDQENPIYQTCLPYTGSMCRINLRNV